MTVLCKFMAFTVKDPNSFRDVEAVLISVISSNTFLCANTATPEDLLYLYLRGFTSILI